MAKASGTVYRSNTQERISGATVKAFNDKETLYATTGKDGNFSMDIQGAGNWNFVVLHEGSLPNKPHPANMDQDRTDIDIYLNRLAGEEDNALGKIFFWVSFGALGVLIPVYVLLHLFLPQPTLSASLQKIQALTGEVNESLNDSAAPALQTSLGELQDSLGRASEKAQAVEAQASAAPQGLTSIQLADIRRLTRTRSAQRFELWRDDPLRFLEILFWGLAGILVNKIILTGWYLRSQRFYKEGVVMHIAHLATTPLLVLVSVLLLSLVTLKFTLAGGNEITLDLSDPRIMAAFAFIIGTSPWPLWQFIENAAKRFTSQFD